MIKGISYFTLRGRVIDLSLLDAEERAAVTDLIAKQRSVTEMTEYSNYYMPALSSLYLPRGLTHRQITETVVWKIAQDLDGRLMVAADMARAPDDYRDSFESVIRSDYPTQKAFCDATGLTEDLVSHVLARRKHLAIDTLSEALRRIGYRLAIVPIERV